MKKHLGFWLIVSLAFSLALPIYSMAQMSLTLEDSSGNRISTPGIKSFARGTDNNLVILLNQPFNFTDLVPDISVDGTAGTYSNCNVSAPATVTATQPPAGTSLPITFKVKSNTVNATLSLVVDPEGRTLPASSASPFTFPSWEIGGTTPAAVGSYLAVFQGQVGTQTPSQLVVMININPSETVSAPTVSGPSTGSVGVSYTFTASGSTVTPSGHSVQYMFTWDDQTNSGWLPVGQTTASKSWSTIGSHNVTVQARCATDTSVVSGTSTASITISNIPTYTVNVSVVNSAGGSVSPMSVPGITSGGQATFTVTTNSGYTASVSEGTLSGTTWTITTVTSTHTATITFTQQQNTSNCSQSYLQGTPRAAVTVSASAPQCWVFDLPADAKGLLVQIIGRNDYTDAQMAWTFPDGRVFPTRSDEGWILGPGTRSVNMQLRSQSTFSPNIPDTYIPQGRHTMTITGGIDGFMTVGF